jgi:phage shock protein PspC (stress-responsive transcriptional regulator)
MKRTVSVNLNGRVFTIDEDACAMLSSYLDNLKIHFRNEDGSDEIVADFEARIQELLSEYVDKGSWVISLYQVEEVIARVGRPDEFEDETNVNGAYTQSSGYERQTAAGSSSADSSFGGAQAGTKRKFFRNPNDRLLAGICSGLAVYFGWELLVVRILMVVLAVVPQVGFLIVIAYLVCWLITPSADNAERQLLLQGKPVTVENIGKMVSAGIDSVFKPQNDQQRGCITALLIGIVVVLFAYFLTIQGLFTFFTPFESPALFFPLGMMLSLFIGIPLLIVTNILIARIEGLHVVLKVFLCIIASIFILALFRTVQVTIL